MKQVQHRPRPPEDKVKKVLEQIKADGPKLDQILMNKLTPASLQLGLTPAVTMKFTATQCSEWYEMARALCDAGEFQKALPICAHLSALDLLHPGYAFLAGTCFQRTGKHEEAMLMFQSSVLLHNAPITLFRIGECLHALGRNFEALGVLRKSLQLAHAQKDAGTTAKMAQERIDLILTMAKRFATKPKSPSATTRVPATQPAAVKVNTVKQRS